MNKARLDQNPIHLGLDARASEEPAFDGNMAWYGTYVQRHAADGREGRLVTQHTFTESWPSWEMHPEGDEVVLCLAGEMHLHQQQADGTLNTVVLLPGEYAINPPGVWHTADVTGPTTALFITAGWGTEGRARE